jgi:uncharacterized protein YjbI with pentapeptide repeats
MEPTQELTVTAIGDTEAGSVLWRLGGQLHATVILKARFRMKSGARASIAEPQGICLRDLHRDGDPLRSITAATDLVPYRSHCDVWLVGHAYAPPGRPQPVMPCRLAVYQGQSAVVDKTIHVYGTRGPSESTQVPFQKMALTFERAYGGPGVLGNPVGTGAKSGSTPPNLVMPDDPTAVACFAPLATMWRNTAFQLSDEIRRKLHRPPFDLPGDLDWNYFQAAPSDQRAPFLRGDEWLVLDGMHPALPRMQTQLPLVRGRANAWAHDAKSNDPGYPLPLMADTLAIDTDEQTFTVTWRGSFPLRSADAIPTLRIAAGLELAGTEPDWERARALWHEEEDATTQIAPAVNEGGDPLTQTAFLTSADIKKAMDGIPFDLAKPGEPSNAPWLRPAPIPNAPWAEDEAPASVRLVREDAPPEDAEPQSVTLDGPEDPLAGTITDDGATTASSTLPFDGAGARRLPGEAPPPVTGLPFQTGVEAPPAAGPSPPAPPEPPPAPPKAPAIEPTHPSETAPPPPPSENELPFAPAAPPARPSSEGLPFAAPPKASQPTSPEGAAERNIPSALPFKAQQAPEEPALPPSGTLPFGTADEEEAALPEEVRGDIVPPVTETSLLVATLPWQVKPPQPSLTVIVKGTFDLIAGAEAELREESEFPNGNVHYDDDQGRSIQYPSDFAILKPRCDVTAVGTAHHPDGAGDRMEVGFRFGDAKTGFARRVAVFGDRVWGAVNPTAPQSFETMPLRYERAFGGAGHTKNPHGLGASPDESGARPLPNIEAPDALIANPSDAPAPACLGPVPAAWRYTRAHVGTYGGDWLAKRWPYFPEDFDYHFFQHAPDEQQLDAIAGDESWQAAGMSPGGAPLEGRLPALRVRCFAKKLEKEGGDMFEVNLRLDTVAFDFDETKVNLVWRGLIDVSDQYASELAALFVIAEPMKQPPMPLSDAPAAYRRAVLTLSRVDDEPDDAGPANDTEGDDNDTVLRRAEQHRAEAVTRALPFEGGATAPAEEPPLPPGPDAEQVRAHLVAAGASDEQVEASVAALTAVPADGGGPKVTREGVLRFLEAGGDIATLDLSGADLSGIDLSGQPLQGAILSGTNLAGASLQNADLGAALLDGADLTDANLEGVNLEQADAQRAVLARCNLARANLEDADLTGANADDAIFVETNGEGCSFAEGSYRRARFDKALLPAADFTDCELDGASFDEAQLPEIRLYEASGEAVSFVSSNLTDARADGVHLPKATCRGVTAEGSIWTGAELDGATFESSRLMGASFERTSSERVVFGKCDLRESNFKEAKLKSATFVSTNAMQSDFESADLTGVDFRRANLHACELWKATLESAKLDDAILTGTKLEK